MHKDTVGVASSFLHTHIVRRHVHTLYKVLGMEIFMPGEEKGGESLKEHLKARDETGQKFAYTSLSFLLSPEVCLCLSYATSLGQGHCPKLKICALMLCCVCLEKHREI